MHFTDVSSGSHKTTHCLLQRAAPGVHPQHVQQRLCLLQLAAMIEFSLLNTQIYRFYPLFIFFTNMEIHFIHPIKSFIIFDIK